MTKKDALIRALPKTELHLHIEGSLEPEMMFDLARRNGVKLPYDSVEAVRKAYNFSNLQSFLDLYYSGASVLITRQDFYDLTWAYLKRCKDDNVVHSEIFFDPQTHTDRGIPFKTVISGIGEALRDGHEQLNISSRLIMSFLRHLPEDEGFKTLEMARPYLKQIDGVGLDSSEIGHPPAKFQRLFSRCKELGLARVAHAGEEGGSGYVWEAIKLLDVCRIDHGVRSMDDDSLIEMLAKTRLPLTVCPYSNIRLRLFRRLEDHNLAALLAKGVCVTVNSDDPAYFGGYVQDNYLGCADGLNLSGREILQLVKNGFEASWLPEEKKEWWMGECDAIAGSYLN